MTLRPPQFVGEEPLAEPAVQPTAAEMFSSREIAEPAVVPAVQGAHRRHHTRIRRECPFDCQSVGASRDSARGPAHSKSSRSLHRRMRRLRNVGSRRLRHGRSWNGQRSGRGIRRQRLDGDRRVAQLRLWLGLERGVHGRGLGAMVRVGKRLNRTRLTDLAQRANLSAPARASRTALQPWPGGNMEDTTSKKP